MGRRAEGLPNDIALDFCKERGLPFIDLREDFQKNSETDMYYDGCHLTPKGSAIFGKMLADELIKKHIV